MILDCLRSLLEDLQAFGRVSIMSNMTKNLHLKIINYKLDVCEYLVVLRWLHLVFINEFYLIIGSCRECLRAKLTKHDQSSPTTHCDNGEKGIFGVSFTFLANLQVGNSIFRLWLWFQQTTLQHCHYIQFWSWKSRISRSRKSPKCAKLLNCYESNQSKPVWHPPTCKAWASKPTLMERKRMEVQRKTSRMDNMSRTETEICKGITVLTLCVQ